VQFEQAESVVTEFRCGSIYRRAGRNDGERPVGCSIRLSARRVERARFGCGVRRVRRDVHRATRHGHGRRNGEPVDDDN
jgi:hypothetical protein